MSSQKGCCLVKAPLFSPRVWDPLFGFWAIIPPRHHASTFTFLSFFAFFKIWGVENSPWMHLKFCTFVFFSILSFFQNFGCLNLPVSASQLLYFCHSFDFSRFWWFLTFFVEIKCERNGRKYYNENCSYSSDFHNFICFLSN